MILYSDNMLNNIKNRKEKGKWVLILAFTFYTGNYSMIPYILYTLKAID